jgi:hypothetical protein
MTKLLEIRDCRNCFYFTSNECLNPNSPHGNKLNIKKFGEIPSWCPLLEKKSDKWESFSGVYKP